jgi:hypothetical protein
MLAATTNISIFGRVQPAEVAVLLCQQGFLFFCKHLFPVVNLSAVDFFFFIVVIFFVKFDF